MDGPEGLLRPRLAASLLQAAAASSLSSPRMTILSASSGSGRCNPFASSHGAASTRRAPHPWSLLVRRDAVEIAHRRRLRTEQREVDHIEPAQDAVDDRPEDRVVGRVADRDGEGAAKANAPLRTLCFDHVVAASVHLRSIINLASLCKQLGANPAGVFAERAHLQERLSTRECRPTGLVQKIWRLWRRLQILAGKNRIAGS
jgi:hypothetical protein